VSTRKDQKEALRQERLERERAAASAARRKRLVGYGLAAVLAVAGLAAVAFAAFGGDGGDGGGGGGGDGGNGGEVQYPDEPPRIQQPREFDLRKAADAARCELVNPPNEGADHVETRVTYRANPPTSGNHHPIPSEDRAFESSPATENLVHSLEHGRILIQFRPNAPQSVIDQLYALYLEDTYHTIITPNGTGMRPLVAATAWDHALHCNALNPQVFDAIRAFKERYRDKGPEFVP
jgi:hypothetical protein